MPVAIRGKGTRIKKRIRRAFGHRFVSPAHPRGVPCAFGDLGAFFIGGKSLRSAHPIMAPLSDRTWRSRPLQSFDRLRREQVPRPPGFPRSARHNRSIMSPSRPCPIHRKKDLSTGWPSAPVCPLQGAPSETRVMVGFALDTARCQAASRAKPFFRSVMRLALK
jgi:hypothetical protein